MVCLGTEKRSVQGRCSSRRLCLRTSGCLQYSSLLCGPSAPLSIFARICELTQHGLDEASHATTCRHLIDFPAQDVHDPVLCTDPLHLSSTLPATLRVVPKRICSTSSPAPTRDHQAMGSFERPCNAEAMLSAPSLCFRDNDALLIKGGSSRWGWREERGEWRCEDR